jgi:predicted MFS family arabinose efflux permease
MQVDKPSTIIAAVALSCIGVFGILAAPIFANILGAGLQLDTDQIGLIIFAEIAGGALASILASFWIQKANWRLAASFAVIVVIVINILSGFQSDPTMLAVLRFLAGFLGQGIAFAVAIGIINASSNPDRLFGFAVASQVSIGVLTLLVLPGLGELYGIKGVLWPLALLAVVALPMLPSVPTKSPKRVEAGASAPVTGSATPAIIALAVLLIWCIGLGAVWAFLINIGVAGGLENTAAGQALAISTTIGIAGALAASWLAGRGGRLAPVGIALLIQIGAIMLLQGEMSFLRFTATCAVFQVFWNFTGPYLMGMVAASDNTGRISVLIPVAQTGGFAIGPAIAGSIMAGDSLTGANNVGMAGILVALVIFVPTVVRLAKQEST